MFGRAIWDKFPECIFENFEISKFSKITRLTCPKYSPNQTCEYWLITSTASNYKLATGQLQNRGQ